MAFLPSISLESPIDLTLLESQESGGERLIRIGFGEDRDADEVFSIVVALTPVVGLPDEFELVFFLSRSLQGGEILADYWDGESTRAFLIKKEWRELALRCVLTAVEQLIGWDPPPAIFMTTHQAHLPQKALVKYAMILKCVQDCKYTVQVLDSYHGRHAWRMIRQNS